MKNYIFTLFFILTLISAQAQTEITTPKVAKESEKIQTLFSSPVRVGWWISPDFGWTKLDSRDALMSGMSGGVILNHTFSIGFAFYGIMNSQDFMYSGISSLEDLYLNAGYGGLKLEYRLHPLKKIHVAFPLLIGGGGVSYNTRSVNNMQNNDYFHNDLSYADDTYFVFEPGVEVGFNLLKFMRFDTGVSYRFASSVELPKTSSNLMNGFNMNFSLKFGKF
jgi:hypothetical protein